MLFYPRRDKRKPLKTDSLPSPSDLEINEAAETIEKSKKELIELKKKVIENVIGLKENCLNDDELYEFSVDTANKLK